MHPRVLFVYWYNRCLFVPWCISTRLSSFSPYFYTHRLTITCHANFKSFSVHVDDLIFLCFKSISATVGDLMHPNDCIYPMLFTILILFQILSRVGNHPFNNMFSPECSQCLQFWVPHKHLLEC